MNRRDWLLSAIAQAGNKGLSPIQIQKIMFLLRMEAADYVGRGFYAFEPYNYGPFSSVIYKDVDRLVYSGMLREQKSDSYNIYVATTAGRDRANVLIGQLDKRARDYLSKLVRWVISVDFGQLLRSIYAKYPKYAAKSLFRR